MPVQSFSVLSTVGFNASSSGVTYQTFGFRASTVQVDNMGSVPLYIKFDVAGWTSCAGTTTGLCIFACANQNRRTFDFGDRLSASTVTLWATSTAAGVAEFAITALGL